MTYRRLQRPFQGETGPSSQTSRFAPRPFALRSPAPTLQRTLGILDPAHGRRRFREKGAIEENVPDSTSNRAAAVNLLFYWGQLNEEKHFASWQEAIDQALAGVVDLMSHPLADEILELLSQPAFDENHARQLKALLVVEPRKLAGADQHATDVQPIDVHQAVQVDVVDLDGTLLKQIDMVHPIFSRIVQDEHSFIIVKLPPKANASTFETPVLYNGKTYRIDLMAGSSIKGYPGNPGSVYGIEEGSVDTFKDLFGFEESAYYAQRALFPLVNAGVQGRVRGRAYPQEKGMEHVFHLRDGTPVQVDDGWGYIKRSLAAKMQEGGMQYEKRQPRPESGRASYQMLEWFDEDAPEVVEELVRQGLETWSQAHADHQEKTNPENADANQLFLARKTLHSLLTTGKPPMEMAVSMPVTGSDLVVPQQQERYTSRLPGDVSVIRSPVDKQNFRPVSREHVEQHAQISQLVGDIEGIQYTLTGREDGALTFFKGMVGVIADDLWPEDWEEVDLVVSSKDRKLFERWVRDSSLEDDPAPVEDPRTDRAAMSRSQQDFTIEGTLAAIQWFAQGSFVGVPSGIQKWLGGDYDGDEIGMIFGQSNPKLQEHIRDRAFQEEEINPKLPKTFTYNPGASRSGRLAAMRSPNVGNWSKIAAEVRSLPLPLKEWIAAQTENGRLLPDDPSLNALPETQRMEKEIQLGIKVGTDGYKTSVSVQQFEERATHYLYLLKQQVEPIQHDKKLLQVIEQVGSWPTLEAPAWQHIFFSYDEVDRATGEHRIKGVSARVLRHMIWGLLAPEERAAFWGYYQAWKATRFDPHFSQVPEATYVCEEIERSHNLPPGATAAVLQRIDFGAINSYQKFESLFVREASAVWQKMLWMDELRPLLRRYYFAELGPPE